MNRRDFFKFGVLPAALIVVPAKTIFLPPRGGWFQQIRMRECEQYCINTDSFRLRWDVAWGEHQFWYEPIEPLPWPGVKEMPAEQLEFLRDSAREAFRRIYEREGLWRAKQRQLPLPRASLGIHAMYV